jgi:hypothetical protein
MTGIICSKLQIICTTPYHMRVIANHEIKNSLKTFVTIRIWYGCWLVGFMMFLTLFQLYCGRETRTPLKTGGKLVCSRRVGSSCSTSGTLRVNLVTNPVISHKWGKNWSLFVVFHLAIVLSVFLLYSLRILITPLVSSNSSYYCWYTKCLCHHESHSKPWN